MEYFNLTYGGSVDGLLTNFDGLVMPNRTLCDKLYK